MVDGFGQGAAPRVPASLQFSPSVLSKEQRLRERMACDVGGAAYREAASEWLTRLLRAPLAESLPQITSEAMATIDAQACWRSMRAGFGELARVTFVKLDDIGPPGVAAGSYEPEIHGWGPTRVLVEFTALGTDSAAEIVVRVCFRGGRDQPASVSLERVAPLPRALALAAPAAGRLELERLSEAICAAPDDDAPRAALAAVWMAQGEPRGDFVRAQLAGDELLAQALLAQHGAAWTDGLPVAREGRVYRRGFLSEARVACSANDLEQSIENPAWNLLTALQLGVMGAAGEFLQHAQLASLRRLTGIDVATMGKAPRQVTHLGVHGRVLGCPAHLETLEVVAFDFEELWIFARQERYPQLARLSVGTLSELKISDTLVIQGLLAQPRPALVVLRGLRGDVQRHTEVWRLAVAGDDWQFFGDPQVEQQLRDMAATQPPDPNDEEFL